MRMIRAVALATAIGAASAASAHAQVIGFRLGLSMSKASIEGEIFEGAEDPDRTWLTAFTGGGFIRFGAGQIAIQPELFYVTKGVKFEDEANDAEGSLKLDYIEVPVLLFLGLGSGASTPYVVVGPAFSFEASCSVEAEGGGLSLETDCDEEGAEDNRKKLDVGAMFGAGLAFPAGPGSIVVDGRFNLGLMNIIDDETDDSFKHRTFSFTAGYQIPLGVR